jgi:hypothetical protein
MKSPGQQVVHWLSEESALPEHVALKVLRGIWIPSDGRLISSVSSGRRSIAIDEVAAATAGAAAEALWVGWLCFVVSLSLSNIIGWGELGGDRGR